ncbi:unnamed protein product [Periconia digitata]|uniref:Uncharacterized protein n=1 Tax=Periconia digitata TaxID=1303443 RepID=A0A9W4UV18_9PLEO|nr:unnamed protein product [Periconia digitata]
MSRTQTVPKTSSSPPGQGLCRCGSAVLLASITKVLVSPVLCIAKSPSTNLTC